MPDYWEKNLGRDSIITISRIGEGDMGVNGMRQIAFYGKGGIGKSTVACNLAIALQESGRHVMQVGCSPKVDSTSLLAGGEPLDYNILEEVSKRGISEEVILSTVQEGTGGVLCVESGGPEPGEGCAGRGVATALDLLHQFEVFKRRNIDFILYDVLGDVACGGFAQPMRSGYATEIYLVTSGELMSLYSSNNICKAIVDISKLGLKIGVGGLIVNMRGVEKEMDVVHEFSEMIHVPVLATLPRSGMIQEAENMGGTVMQHFRTSEEAKLFVGLAQNILLQERRFIPTPIELEDILNILRKHQVFD